MPVLPAAVSILHFLSRQQHYALGLIRHMRRQVTAVGTAPRLAGAFDPARVIPL
jgi:hypothetical protein